MPKVVNHQERRAEIVAATWEAIAEVGLDGATMRAIAERAGCTTGRLTHYFSGREEILTAALRRVHEDAGTRMIRAAAGRSGADALRAVLLEALPLDDERRLEWRVWLAFWAQAAVDEQLRSENEQRYDEWRDIVDRLLRAAAPGLTAPERRVRADELVLFIDGLGVRETLARASDRTARAAAIRRSVDRAVVRALEPLGPTGRRQSPDALERQSRRLAPTKEGSP